MAQPFQDISRLACEGGAFAVQARAFDENEAGSSRVDIRYLYKEQALPAIRYELFYKNLEAYLQRDLKNTRSLGLNLDTSGMSRGGGKHEQGDTLYLSPARFSAPDFEALANCLQRHAGKIRGDFEQAVVSSSAFLGLMKTRSTLGVNGIARLVHAEAPISGLYANDWYFMLVEHGGRVIVHSNYTANNKAESAVIGSVAAKPDGTRLLRLQREFSFAGKTRQSASPDYLEIKDRHGRRAKDDFEIEIQ